MIKFTKEKIKILHRYIAQETDSNEGVIYDALLESSLEEVFGNQEAEDAYPTKEEKAARLAYSLIKNRPFVDGNTCLGMYVMLVFLEVNCVQIMAGNEEIADVGARLAEDEMDYEALLSWLRSHRV